MTSRECIETTAIDGWRIPAGSVIYIDIRGIQRSPGGPASPITAHDAPHYSM